MSELSWGQTVPLWYESGLKPPSAADIVRTPQPDQRSRDHQAVDDGVDRSRRDDPAPEQVADVRAERVDLLLVAVEREDVEAAALSFQNASSKRVAQLVGLSVEPLGELSVAPDLPGELRQPPLRVVDVALGLDRRDRRVRERPVGVALRVPGVLPGLVGEAGLAAPLVLDEAVAVAVAVLVDPGERRSAALERRTSAASSVQRQTSESSIR